VINLWIIFSLLLINWDYLRTEFHVKQEPVTENLGKHDVDISNFHQPNLHFFFSLNVVFAFFTGLLPISLLGSSLIYFKSFIAKPAFCLFLLSSASRLPRSWIRESVSNRFSISSEHKTLCFKKSGSALIRTDFGRLDPDPSLTYNAGSGFQLKAMQTHNNEKYNKGF
jgi:hypothetical protein